MEGSPRRLSCNNMATMFLVKWNSFATWSATPTAFLFFFQHWLNLFSKPMLQKHFSNVHLRKE